MRVSLWKNFQRIFVFLRFDIKDKNNFHIIDIIIKVINNNISNEEMCKMIFYIMPKWKGQLIVEEGEWQEMILNTQLKQFTIRALELMKTNILNQEYEIAYDIADMSFQKKWKCSREENPYDTACIESFHWVMKKEEIYTSMNTKTLKRQKQLSLSIWKK